MVEFRTPPQFQRFLCIGDRTLYVTCPTFTHERVKTVKIIIFIWIKMVNKDIRNMSVPP